MRPAGLVIPALALLITTSAQALPAGTHVVISELQTRGSNGGGDEFVELLNPTCTPIDISGWKIDYRSSTAPSFAVRATVPAGVLLDSGRHYLVTGSAYDGPVTGDQSLSAAIGDAGALRLITSGDVYVDGIGYYYNATTQSTVTLFAPEGTPVSNLPHTDGSSGASNSDVSLVRKAGVQDTDDNAFDFESGAANPESSSSPVVALDCATGVGSGRAPDVLGFSVAGPNPFRDGTLLSCALPTAAHVRIEVLSIDGRRVATLAEGMWGPGTHLVPWHAGAAGSGHFAPGVYLVRLTAGGEHRSVRVVALN